MGFDFNLQNIYAAQSINSPRFQMPETKVVDTQSTYYSPISYNPSLAKIEEKKSILETANLISSLKTRYTDSFMKTFGYRIPKAETRLAKDTSLDFTVAQNYGIVCPKDTKESTVKEATLYANYGIVCSTRDTKIDESPFLANYGIVINDSNTFFPKENPSINFRNFKS